MDKSRKIMKWLGIVCHGVNSAHPVAFCILRDKADGCRIRNRRSFGTSNTRVNESKEIPTVALPTAAPAVANGQEPPPCTFPLAQTTTTESAPENYTFSEPKVVLTVSHAVDIYQWLPDNQRVLIGQETDPGQSIALFNPQTGNIQVFGSRGSAGDGSPVWVTGLNAVVYPRTAITGSQLMISRGDPANVQLLDESQPTSNAPRFFLGV